MMETKSEYKMTELGKIPSEWKIAELKEISEVITGSTPKTNNPALWQGKYMFVTPSDMNGQRYMYSTERYITDEALNLSRVIPKNSIMVTCIASIGKISIATEECTTNQQINTVIPNSKVSHEYLYYFLSKRKPRLKLLASQTTVPIINKKTFSKLKVVLPPLLEQQKIAEILSTVDEHIEQTDQLIEKTKELKKGLMQQLLIKGVGHTEFKQSAIGEIPVDWEVKPLEEIADVKGGKRLPKGKSLVEDNTGFPYIRVSDMESGGVSLNNIQYVPREVAPKISSYRIYKGELFISVAGTLGIVGDIPIQLDGANLTENANRICNITINHSYLKYLLTSSLIQNEIDKVKTTSAQPKLALTRIKKFLITVPPLKEQQKIADILSSVDEDIEGYEEEKMKYEELKKGLMQQLLTGKTRVKIED